MSIQGCKTSGSALCTPRCASLRLFSTIPRRPSGFPPRRPSRWRPATNIGATPINFPPTADSRSTPRSRWQNNELKHNRSEGLCRSAERGAHAPLIPELGLRRGRPAAGGYACLWTQLLLAFGGAPGPLAQACLSETQRHDRFAPGHDRILDVLADLLVPPPQPVGVAWPAGQFPPLARLPCSSGPHGAHGRHVSRFVQVFRYRRRGLLD